MQLLRHRVDFSCRHNNSIHFFVRLSEDDCCNDIPPLSTSLISGRTALDGDVAQLSQRRTGTPLRQVRFPGAAKDFSPGVLRTL